MLLSHDLRAFIEVARRGSFVMAAKALHVTQSAVSQRIATLEERLEARLFTRGRERVTLTPEGAALLRYAVSGEALEEELLGALGAVRAGGGPGAQAGAKAHGGTLRVGAFSSLSRSVILPTLAGFLHENPRVRLDLRTREVWELERLLTSREVDLVVTPHVPLRDGVASAPLGSEANVLVQLAHSSSLPGARPRSGSDPSSAPVASLTGDVQALLDHDEFDDVTEAFVRLQRATRDGDPARADALAAAKRHFVDDIDGILAGVEAGLGNAVLPRHLLHTHPALGEVAGYSVLETPVFLCWHHAPEPPRLVRAAMDVLAEGVPRFLAPFAEPEPSERARARGGSNEPREPEAQVPRTRRANASRAARPRSKVSVRTDKTKRQ